MPRRRKVPVEEQENEVADEVPVKKSKSKEKPAKKFKKEPEWMKSDGVNVAKLVLSIQKSDCNNTKVIAELTRLYNKMGHKPFMAAFMKMTMMFLIREDNDEYSPRVLKFIGTFVASFGEEVVEDGGSHLIIQHVFDEILSITSKQFHVRVRICQLVSHIMCSFSQKAELDEKIMDQVIERMLNTFVKDISPVVRQNAIMALQRLQDPDNSEDQVTRAYLFHMETDPVAKVRQAAITAIAKKLPVFPNILDRLSDNDEKVRRHTYLQMSSVAVKSYKIADRIKILFAGLNDRSEMVKKAVHNILIPNWIAAYENDYTEFIKAIKLDSNDSDLIKFRILAQDALFNIFKKRQVKELISFLNLTPDNEFRNCLSLDKANSIEWLIVWKNVIKCHQNYTNGRRRGDCIQESSSDHSDDEVNDSVSNADIMPDLSTFCDFVEKFLNEFKITIESEEVHQNLNFNHCIIVLLEIAQTNDFGDVIGCTRLQAVLRKILTDHNVSDHVIKEIAHVVELLNGNVETRLNFFNEIAIEMLNLGSPSEYSRQTIVEDLISKVDINIQVKANSLKMEMMELKEQETVFVERKHYANAQKVSEKYTQLNEELIELLRPFAESVDSSSSLVDCLSSAVVAKKVTPSEILKNLRICFYAVMMKGVVKITPEILKTYNSFVRYHLESSDIATRSWALKTATAYSLIYQPISKEIYLKLKSQLFKSNNGTIWEVTINCVVDLLLRYSIAKMDCSSEVDQENSVNNSQHNRSKKGGRTLYTDDVDDTEELDIVTSIDIIAMLTHILDSTKDKNVHKTTLVGLCKLILHGQYCTREIVSKFMLAYFNPASEPEVNQILGIFFESVIKMKKQESLHDALIPTLMTLLEAPHDSPLREVKQDTVIKYVIGATRPIFCSNGLNLHNTLGLKLISLMKENLDNKEIHKIFSKELLTLEIGDDPLLKKDMIVHIEVVLKNISTDARTRKNLTDFCDMLKGTYRPSLKFSSTAMTTNTADDEDAGIPEEDEEELESTVRDSVERFNSSDIMDMSLSKVKMGDLVVNVTNLNFIPDDSVDQSPDITMTEQSAAETSNRSCRTLAEETQTSFREKSPPSTQTIEIPATQADEEPEELTSSDSDDELDETVLESIVVGNSSNEEVSIPATPDTPQTRGKISFANKRQLELSLTVNSPLRKNPRNGQSPKPSIVSSRQASAMLSPKSSTVPSLKASASSSPKPSTSSSPAPRKKSSSAPVTPASPKTPSLRFSALGQSKSSTPINERTTRRQAKEDLAQSVTLTRSASKKMNVDLEEITQKVLSSPARKPVKMIEKPVKKTALPVPTKTSTMRNARLESAAPKQDPAPGKTRSNVTNKATATAPLKTASSQAETAAPRASRRQATVVQNPAADKKGRETKQRPRWA